MVVKFLDLPEETTLCKHCGNLTPFDDMIWLNGEMYCPDCYKRIRFQDQQPKQQPKPRSKHCSIIKDLRSQTGLSQIKFAEKFEIPVKSLQNWEAERTTPPPYVIFMIKSILAFETKEGEKNG